MSETAGRSQEAKRRLKQYLAEALREETKAAADYVGAADLAREAGDILVAVLLTNLARDESRHAEMLEAALRKYQDV